jgi:hypothetical protein
MLFIEQDGGITRNLRVYILSLITSVSDPDSFGSLDGSGWGILKVKRATKKRRNFMF